MLTQQETRHLAIAYQAIRGQISWPKAAKKLKVTRVHARICSLLRKEYLDSIKNQE